MKTIIQVNNVSKNFDKQRAVENLSFQVEKGELFSILGPNGAGKSTISKLMTTYYPIESGEIVIDELHLTQARDREQVKRKIGIVFQESLLDGELSCYQNLVLRGRLYEKNKLKNQEKVEEILKAVDAWDYAKQKYGTLSGGQRRRVDIARALLTKPEVLFLDEPTTGLDVASRMTIWKVITDLQKKSQLTVILTTHYMEEANASNHILMMKSGKTLATGTPKELKEKYKTDSLDEVFLRANRESGDDDAFYFA
jgi:multidrug/hemolysin transport system ATP-binding protein